MAKSTSTPINQEFGSAVTLFVGDNRMPFVVHLHLISRASLFFRSAFNSGFKEGAEKRMNLLDDDADTVNLFLQWLYYKETYDFGRPNYLAPESDHDYLLQPIRALIFADKYESPSFQLYILRQLAAHAEKFSNPPSNQVMVYACQNTCLGSGIRKFLADWYVWGMPSECYQLQAIQDWLSRIPDFAVDLLIAQGKVLKNPGHNPFNTFSPYEYLDVRGVEPASDGSSKNMEKEKIAALSRLNTY